MVAIMTCKTAMSIMFASSYYINLFYKKNGANISIIRFDNEWFILINATRNGRQFIGKITNLIFFDIVTRENVLPEDLLIMHSLKHVGQKNKIAIFSPMPWIASKPIYTYTKSYTKSFIEKGAITYHKYVVWYIPSLRSCFGIMKNKSGQLKYFYNSAVIDPTFNCDNNYTFADFHGIGIGITIKDNILDNTWQHSMVTPYVTISKLCKRDAIRKLNRVLSLHIIYEVNRVEILGLLDILDLGSEEIISKQTFINIINKEYGFRSITRDVNKYILKSKILETNELWRYTWYSLMYALHHIDLFDEDEYVIPTFDETPIINLAKIIPIIKSFQVSRFPIWHEFIACISEISNSEIKDGVPPKIFGKILSDIYQSEVILLKYICE